MVRVTFVFAVLLIALGLIGYAGDPSESRPSGSGSAPATEQSDAGDATAESKRSITALIPTFTGACLFVLGALALNEKWRMHAIHGAVIVGLLGLLAAGGRGATGMMKLMSDNPAVNGRSLFFVCAMAVLCGVHVGLCVQSFLQARKRRREEIV